MKKPVTNPNPRRQFLKTSLGLGLSLSLSSWLGLNPTPAAASQTSNSDLQQQVNQLVKGMRRRGLVSGNEKTAWSVYDFTTGKKLVSINEDKTLQAASMIKPFIALAYFYRHRDNPRRYPYDARVRHLMTAMLRDSSNTATNTLINRISPKKSAGQRPKAAERLLKQRAASIFRQTRIVEFIPKNGRSYRNRASARDYSRFLFALWNNRLPFSKELKYYMGLGGNDRIATRAKDVPASVRVYDKTGSTARLCGNMGVVAARGRNGKTYPYTFVAIIEKSRRARNYGRWIRGRGDVIRAVSSLVYRSMKQRHRLV